MTSSILSKHHRALTIHHSVLGTGRRRLEVVGKVRKVNSVLRAPWRFTTSSSTGTTLPIPQLNWQHKKMLPFTAHSVPATLRWCSWSPRSINLGHVTGSWSITDSNLEQTDKVLIMYLIKLGNVYIDWRPFLQPSTSQKGVITYLRWSYLVADLEFGLEVSNTVAAGNYWKGNTGNWGSSYIPECWRKSVNGEFLFGKVSILEDGAEVVANGQILPHPLNWIGHILGHYMSLSFLNSTTHWNCVLTRMLTWKHNLAWDLKNNKK